MTPIHLKTTSVRKNKPPQTSRGNALPEGEGCRRRAAFSRSFFQAAHANSETTPSVTDRDVNVSVPAAPVHPSSPKAPVWLLCMAGGQERISAQGLLEDLGCGSKSAQELQRWKDGCGEEGRSYCHCVGFMGPVFLKPLWLQGCPGRGRRTRQVGQRCCVVLGALFS